MGRTHRWSVGSLTPNSRKTFYLGGPLKAVHLYNESNVEVRTVTNTKGNEDEIKSTQGSVPHVDIVHDSLYRLKNLSDDHTHTTNHAYDAVGNLTQRQYPRFGANNFDGWKGLFDADGNLTSSTDGRNLTTTIGQDNLIDSALRSLTYADGTPNLHVDYDVFGRTQRLYNGDSTATAPVLLEYT